MKKILLTTLLSFTLLAGFSIPQVSNAQGGPVTEVGPNLYTNLVTTAKNIESTIKEYVLDGLAWQIANVALEQMTQDIVTWINSGFNGSPAFIQDPGRFLTGIADGIAGDFLQELGGGFLCSPFSADIRFSLEVGYYAAGGNSRLADRYSCTLSDALGNVDDFLNNDLSQGGLEQFFNVTARPQNNPYTLALDLRQELDGRIFGALEGERQLLDWNGGFLSKRECKEGETEPNCTGDVLTPGDTIQNQLNDSLGIGRDRLLVADDINEIIGALMNQLVTQALGGARGLVGTSNSGGGSPSYFDQTNNPGVNADDRDQLETLLNNGVRDGEQSNRILSGALTKANDVTNIIFAAQSGSCSSADLSRLADISSEVSGLRSDIVNTQNGLDSSIRTLRQLQGDLLNSNSRTEYLAILERFQSLAQAGRVPNEATVGQARIIDQQLSVLRTEAQTLRANCGV